MYRICLMLIALLGAAATASGQAMTVRIIYAEQKIVRPPVLSGLRPVPDDLGRSGAELGLAQNATTGKFTGQAYEMHSVVAETSQHLADLLKTELAKGPSLVVVNAPAAELLAVADLPEARGSLLFDAATPDDALREEQCRANVLHTLPSRAMLTDALAQFFLKKQWVNWLLISGPRENDKAYAEALRASAVKFGLKIAAERAWDLEGDMRESAGTEIPLMTQDADYDAVVVADENDDFGPLIAYNTFQARPVAGTHGLVATGWSDVIEPWGAVQLQNQFHDTYHRGMRDIDFAAFIAVRLVGEAVTRTKSNDVAAIQNFLLSPDFQMQAYKGQGVSFRGWNGQLRQPIHLVTKDTQVAMAPVEGFLHEATELDTLGQDRPETKCTAFAK